METLVVSKKADFQELERAFQQVSKWPSIRLRLPNGFHEAGTFGIEGLVCLLLATWIRNHPGEKVLHTYSSAHDSSQFEDLCSRLYGICALRLSDVILLENKEQVIRDVALKSGYQRVRKVISGDFRAAYKGLYLAIPSIKSSDVNREFNNPFYRDGEIIGKNGFKSLVKKAIESTVPQRNRAVFVESAQESIAEIVRELFDNTHKHGRRNAEGDILPDNFRGVIFNSSVVSKERLSVLRRNSVDGMLGIYLEWQAWCTDNDRDIPVLDITIVDAGPGYARRWTGKSKEELSFSDEASAVINCFKKNNSTSRNFADGSGLTHVLNDVNRLRGWFRLRTGSVSVSKSFLGSRGSTEITEKDVFKEGSFVDGASFNIVIPLVNIIGATNNV